MISGFLKIDKEADYTSSDVDRVIKRQLDVPKVGHLGTLDPFATGLLIISVNEACKLTPMIPDGDKEYVATLCLGKTTPSLDTETEICDIRDVERYTEDEIKSVLSSMLGRQLQTPPLFSAKHYKGTKAYFLAREGSKITLPPHEIQIHSLELIHYDSKENTIVFKTCVSKGTYIRTLGSDIAKKLGTIGYLTALRRTRIGHFTLDGAIHCKDAKKEDLLPLTYFNPEIKKIKCDETLSFRVKNGQTLKLEEKEDYLFMMGKERLLALYKREGRVYHCYKGIRND